MYDKLGYDDRVLKPIIFCVQKHAPCHIWVGAAIVLIMQANVYLLGCMLSASWPGRIRLAAADTCAGCVVCMNSNG